MRLPQKSADCALGEQMTSEIAWFCVKNEMWHLFDDR